MLNRGFIEHESSPVERMLYVGVVAYSYNKYYGLINFVAYFNNKALIKC